MKERGSARDVVPFGGMHPHDPAAQHLQDPPHNTEAEQALLGAILQSNDASAAVASYLEPRHFFEPIHGKIYEHALALIEKGRRVTPVVLKDYFERDEALADVGGASYLIRLAGSAIGTTNADDYGRAIFDCYLRRGLVDAGRNIVARATSATLDLEPAAQIEEAAGDLFALTESGRAQGSGFVSHREVLDRALAIAEDAYNRGEVLGIPTGLKELDRLLGGFEKGSLYVLAGATGVGKTALAQWLATTTAARAVKFGQPWGVAFFSLEMSTEQLGSRELSTTTGIPLDRLRRGEIDNEDFVKLLDAVTAASDDPLWIDATPGLRLAQIYARVRALMRKGPIGLVVVDYLQLIEADDRYRGNRVAEVSAISKGLKLLARALKVPVLALSQLSRKPGQREDHRPVLGDLRESGSIEQDADAVILLYRHRYYFPDPPEDPKDLPAWEESEDVVEAIIAKQRQGATGTARLYYDPPSGQFGDLDANRMPRMPPSMELTAASDHPFAPGNEHKL